MAKFQSFLPITNNHAGTCQWLLFSNPSTCIYRSDHHAATSHAALSYNTHRYTCRFITTLVLKVLPDSYLTNCNQLTTTKYPFYRSKDIIHGEISVIPAHYKQPCRNLSMA